MSRCKMDGLGAWFRLSWYSKLYWKKELDELKQKEAELEAVVAQYPEIIDEMSEEEKEGDYLNDDNTAFVPAKVKAYCKDANIFGYDNELTTKIKRVHTLIEKEKKLRKDLGIAYADQGDYRRTFRRKCTYAPRP